MNNAADLREYFQIVSGALSVKWCEEAIADAEKRGFVDASLYTDRNGVEYFNYERRKSKRCIIDVEPAVVEGIWERICDVVPATWADGAAVVGINPRLRVLKYLPGGEFKIHADGQYRAPNGDESKLTILIYLNDNYTGAYTTLVLDDGRHVPIVPHTGDIAIQDQDILHYVPPLEDGVKYVIRTDIMYRRPAREDERSMEKKIVIVGGGGGEPAPESKLWAHRYK